jgi:hypothetical protein
MEMYYRTERIEIEKAIIKALDTDTRLDGSKSYGVGHTKVTINKKISRTLDFEAYKGMHFLSENQFVKMQPKIDLKKLREVEKNFPKEVAECITTKPAKIAVTIKEIV